MSDVDLISGLHDIAMGADFPDLILDAAIRIRELKAELAAAGKDMGKRELIGTIRINTGSVIAGDPQSLLPDARDRTSPLEYGDYLEATSDPDLLEPDEGRGPAASTILGDHAAISVPTPGNCNGWAEVYIERGEYGWPSRLIVELEPRAESGAKAVPKAEHGSAAKGGV